MRRMTLHKVSELEGTLLDAAVAKADGWVFTDCHTYGHKPPVVRHGVSVPQRILPGDQRDASGYPQAGRFHPSGDWSQGGPIIERERIDVEGVRLTDWRATVDSIEQEGPTFLSAAMRAYVASKFGEEVQLP